MLLLHNTLITRGGMCQLESTCYITRCLMGAAATSETQQSTATSETQQSTLLQQLTHSVVAPASMQLGRFQNAFGSQQLVASLMHSKKKSYALLLQLLEVWLPKNEIEQLVLPLVLGLKNHCLHLRCSSEWLWQQHLGGSSSTSIIQKAHHYSGA